MFVTPPPEEVLLPTVFRENGYETLMVSAHPWITPRCRLWKSFESSVYVPPPKGETYASFSDLNEALLPLLSTQRTRPFFLYIHALDTHFPHNPTPPYDRWIDKSYSSAMIKAGVSRPTGNAFTEADRELFGALFDGSLASADDAIGQLIRHLKEQGLHENTIFILGADHGDLLGEDGATAGHGVICEEVMHVPLILCGPGIPKGLRIRQLVQNADIMPSLLGLLGLKANAQCDGKPLQPLLSNPGQSCLHEYVFGRHVPVADRAPIFILRNKEFVFTFDGVSGAKTLCKAPDSLAFGRVNVLGQQQDRVTPFEKYLNEELLPKWQASNALPRTEPDIPFDEKLTLERIEPKEAVTVRLETSQDVAAANTPWVLDDGKLTSYKPDGPQPLTLRFSVPNGCYKVQVEAFLPSQVFRYKAQRDTTFRNVSSDSANQTKRREFVDLGEYVVEDGNFTILLEKVEPQKYVSFKTFRFIPLKGETGQDPARDEQLRALGYM